MDFMSFVLDDIQETWHQVLPRAGTEYQDARMVLFRDGIRSACGGATSSTGPFYCPADGKVYLDLSFFDELHRRFGAPGDFAQAYVIAHEIGHHVQNLLGIERQVRTLQGQNPGAANELSDRHPGLGVVVLSQYVDPTTAVEVLGGGSSGRAYLLKERVGDPDQIAAAVREVASGGSMVDSSVVDALIAGRARPSPSPLDHLTPREHEVLAMIATGRGASI